MKTNNSGSFEFLSGIKENGNKIPFHGNVFPH